MLMVPAYRLTCPSPLWTYPPLNARLWETGLCSDYGPWKPRNISQQPDYSITYATYASMNIMFHISRYKGVLWNLEINLQFQKKVFSTWYRDITSSKKDQHTNRKQASVLRRMDSSNNPFTMRMQHIFINWKSCRIIILTRQPCTTKLKTGTRSDDPIWKPFCLTEMCYMEDAEF